MLIEQKKKKKSCAYAFFPRKLQHIRITLFAPFSALMVFAFFACPDYLYETKIPVGDHCSTLKIVDTVSSVSAGTSLHAVEIESTK